MKVYHFACSTDPDFAVFATENAFCFYIPSKNIAFYDDLCGNYRLIENTAFVNKLRDAFDAKELAVQKFDYEDMKVEELIGNLRTKKNLEQKIKQAIEAIQDTDDEIKEMRVPVKWYGENRARLESEYKGKFILIHGTRVVTAAFDQTGLEESIRSLPPCAHYIVVDCREHSKDFEVHISENSLSRQSLPS